MAVFAKTFRALSVCAAVAGIVAISGTADAETKKLKLHSFGSPKQPETKWIFEPLKKDFERHSNNTLSFQVYYGMALGGKPRDLIPQVENGVVDMSYTLPGYHAGRFPILSALELPFIGESGEVFSQVSWDWLEKYAHTEFTNKLKVITLNAIDQTLNQILDRITALSTRLEDANLDPGERDTLSLTA